MNYVRKSNFVSVLLDTLPEVSAGLKTPRPVKERLLTDSDQQGLQRDEELAAPLFDDPTITARRTGSADSPTPHLYFS